MMKIPCNFTIKTDRVTMASQLLAASLCVFHLNYIFIYALQVSGWLMWCMRGIGIGLIFGAFLCTDSRRLSIDKLTVAFLALVVISSVYSMELGNVIFMIAFVIVFRGKDYQGILNKILPFCFIATVLIPLFLATGILKDMYYIIGERNRHSLGFVGLNDASPYFFSVAVCYLIYRKKLEIFDYFLVLFVTVVIYYFTDCRSAFFSTVVIFMADILYTRFGKNRISKFLTDALITVLFFSTFFSAMIAIRFPALDVMLSGRIGKYISVMNDWGWFHFLFGGKPSGLESFYLSFVGAHGFIALILLFVITIRSVHYLLKQKLYLELSIILGSLSYALMENILISTETICFYFFWLFIISPKKVVQGKKAVSYQKSVESTSMLGEEIDEGFSAQM